MIEDPRSRHGGLVPIERAQGLVRPVSSPPHSDLRESLAVLWRHKWSILVITLLAVSAGLFISSRQTPIYESRASILVVPAGLGVESTGPETLNMATEAELMSSVRVARIVARNLDIGDDPRTLLDDLLVDVPSDTEILEISYRASEPEQARRRASAFAQGYLQYRRAGASAQVATQADAIQVELDALELRLTEVVRQLARLPDTSTRRGTLESEAASLNSLILERQLELFDLPDDVTVGRVIQPATLPSSPVNSSHVVAAGLGLVAGLTLGVGSAFLRHRLSQRIRSPEEAEEYLGASVLGTIPRISQWHRRKKPLLITLADRSSPAVEAYRILRTNVLSAAAETGAKSIVITSAFSGEGKSATVANLGVLLARADKRVLMLSADLRKPRLHQFFQGDGSVGLSDVLTGRTPLGAAVREIMLPRLRDATEVSSGTLRILPSGRVPESPAELLTAERMSSILRTVEEGSDIVLIDAPPLFAVTDALVIAQVADGVLVVLGPHSIERTSVSSVRQRLDKVSANVIGAVLNGPDGLNAQTNYSYY